MDKPIHALPPDGTPAGRGLCGAYLCRGWLDGTEDAAKVTCRDCRRMIVPANIDPRSSWVLLLCTDCDQQGASVNPEYVGIGQPCTVCGTGTLTTLRDLQRQAKLGRRLVEVADK